MRTKDILKEALRNFEGTVIVVSHDRDFLSGLADKVYEFANHGVKEYLGGVTDFLAAKKIACFSEYERWKSGKGKGEAGITEQWNREIRKAEQRIGKVEQEIAALEKKQEEMERRMATGEIEDRLYKEYDEVKKRQEECLTEWEAAHEALEELKEKY